MCQILQRCCDFHENCVLGAYITVSCAIPPFEMCNPVECELLLCEWIPPLVTSTCLVTGVVADATTSRFTCITWNALTQACDSHSSTHVCILQACRELCTAAVTPRVPCQLGMHDKLDRGFWPPLRWDSPHPSPRHHNTTDDYDRILVGMAFWPLPPGLATLVYHKSGVLRTPFLVPLEHPLRTLPAFDSHYS